MPIFTKESLETLRQRIDLVEALSPYIELKKAGASYKALCPFHDEKSPSFMVQKGDAHYHCFGCGAHGDAIQFLMSFQKLSFHAAVESLAEKFQVRLELAEGEQEAKGPSKSALKEALDQAARFYHFYLLSTQEGHEALRYLYSRGIDQEFIQSFHIGLAPRQAGLFRCAMHAKNQRDEILADAGLIQANERGYKDFFHDRITFPIHDPSGAVIGFSARKYKEETFGGKYVNTPETPLFKKSRILFALNYCRKRIAKERKAMIVEGQIDALRLIQEGFNITVAGQGTAFGEGHVQELLNLGVNLVYLALDSDNAGQEAAGKIGNFFQKAGVEVRVIPLPQGHDPDSFLREKGPQAFGELMLKSDDYLTFLVRHKSKGLNVESPAAKTELVNKLTAQIKEWENPLMVHESLRKLAHIVQIPEDVVIKELAATPNIYIKRQASIGEQAVDPDKIIEDDFLRWLLLMGESNGFISLAKMNLRPDSLKTQICRKIYEIYLDLHTAGSSLDYLTLMSKLNDSEGQTLLSEIFNKKINKDKAKEQFRETMQRIMDRNWMEARENIKRRIQSGQCSDDEALELVRQFDDLRRNQPKVKEEDS